VRAVGCRVGFRNPEAESRTDRPFPRLTHHRRGQRPARRVTSAHADRRGGHLHAEHALEDAGLIHCDNGPHCTLCRAKPIAQRVSSCFVVVTQHGGHVCSAAVPQRGARVRPAAARRTGRVRVRTCHRTAGAASRGGGATTSGRSPVPDVAGTSGAVRAGPGSAARVVEAPYRHCGHPACLAPAADAAALDLRTGRDGHASTTTSVTCGRSGQQRKQMCSLRCGAWTRRRVHIVVQASRCGKE
jgi:hypothetical protein